MKILSALWFLIIFFGLSTARSQTSLNTLRINFSDQKPGKFNFIDNFSFTPQGDIIQSSPSSLVKFKQAVAPVIFAGAFASNVIEQVNATCLKYAMLMGVEVESLTNVTLYNFIKEWFGTRYRMGGKSKKGIDCSAFTGTLLSAVYELAVPRTARLQYNSCERICKDDLLEGDLVFFNTRGGVSHVGIYLANGHFVHSASSRGVMISSLEDGYFARRFISGGRID